MTGEWENLMRSGLSHFVVDETIACSGRRRWKDDYGWQPHTKTDFRCEKCEVKEKHTMAKKVKLEHSVTQNGNVIAFVNTLTAEQLAKHESWLNGHGMTSHVTSTLGGGSIETAGKLIVVPEGKTIALTFKDKKSAEAVFVEILGEGAIDADDWDDATIYNGGQTEGLASSLGAVAKAQPRMEQKKAKPKKAARR